MSKALDPTVYIPYVAMGVAGIGALATAITKLVTTKMQMDMQRENLKFARDTFKNYPQLYNLPNLPQFNYPPPPQFNFQPPTPHVQKAPSQSKGN